MLSVLSLRQLHCQVRLGWTPGERQVAQTVSFDLSIRFREEPRAARSDQLRETVDYGELAELLNALCRSGEFQLIERLGREAYGKLKARLPEGARLWVRVTKERPPIANLSGGASFAYGDEIAYLSAEPPIGSSSAIPMPGTGSDGG